MAVLGYKPASLARGWGQVSADEMRVTHLGRLPVAGWLREVGVRAGRATGTPTQVEAVLYEQATSTSAPTDRLWAGAAKSASAYMADRSGGANLSWTGITGVLLPAGTGVAGGLRNDVSLTTYGQNSDGTRMYYDNSAPAVPAIYDVDDSSPQGQIDCWLVTQDNRQPDPPTIVSPAADGITADATPGITIAFTDPDTTLGDVFSHYQIEIWDETNTSRLQNSGKVATDATEKSEARATWTAATLTPGTYRIRAYVWDAAGVKSAARQWAFAVNAGGAVTDIVTQATDVVGTVPLGGGSADITNAVRPGWEATWTHGSGENAQAMQIRIRTLANLIGEALGGSVVEVREAWPVGGTVTPGQTVAIAFPGAWADLPRGAEIYIMEVRGYDALGSWSPWAVSTAFVVNAAPSAGSLAPASGTSIAQRPRLEATVTDPGDDDGAHSVTIEIGPAGSPRTAYPATHVGGGVYRLQTTTAHVPALDTYEWTVTATDPWGLSTTSAVQTLHYVAAPAITNITPADEATVPTGTPTITADVDRTITHRRVRILAAGSTQIYWDTGEDAASGSSISEPVPGATLPNATDYDLEIWIRASDGLEATSITQFRVEYDPPWYLAGVTGTAVAASEFDGGGGIAPAQAPNVQLGWVAPDTATVSDEDWLGYAVYRLGGAADRFWAISDRHQEGLVDTSPGAGVAYAYYVGYRRRINAGLDEIESRLVRVDVAPDIRHATITSEGATVPGVTFHHWEDREIAQQIGVETVEVLGQAAPDAWQSPRDYDEFDIEVMALDARDGSFTAQDVVERARALARPREVAIGEGRTVQVPHDLTYRDPRGRAIALAITRAPEERDAHRLDRQRFRLRGTQVHRSVIVPASVNTAQSRDMTGVVEPTLLLPLDGDLAGEDRDGPITATGVGALRFVDGYASGSEAALVEEGTTNLVTNPSAETGASGWNNYLMDPVTQVAGGHSGSYAFQAASHGNSVGYAYIFVSVTPGNAFSAQLAMKGSGASIGKDARLRVEWLDGSFVGVGSPSMSTATPLTGDFVEHVVEGLTVPAGAAWAQVGPYFDSFALASGEVVVWDAVQAETKAYATTYADGSLGPGYSWSGTAHASASTRTYTSLTVPIGSRLDAFAGAVAVRARLHEGRTGEPVLQIGHTSTTFYNLRRNHSSGAFMLSAYTAAGGWQEISLSHPITGEWETIILEWEDGELRLRFGDDAVRTRAVVGVVAFDPARSISLGSGVNADYGPVFAFDRPLTGGERARLAALDDWTWNGLAAD